MYLSHAARMLSSIHGDCMRIGFGCFVDEKSMSPLPSSFSAPAQSMIVRESALLGSVKATRAGMLALMRPVMMFTDGQMCIRDRS